MGPYTFGDLSLPSRPDVAWQVWAPSPGGPWGPQSLLLAKEQQRAREWGQDQHAVFTGRCGADHFRRNEEITARTPPGTGVTCQASEEAHGWEMEVTSRNQRGRVSLSGTHSPLGLLDRTEAVLLASPAGVPRP